MIERFDRLSPAELDAAATTYHRLVAAVQRWTVELTTGSPRTPRRRERGASNDAGL